MILRKIFLTLVLFAGLVLLSGETSGREESFYDALVVVKVPGMTSEQYQAIYNTLSLEKEVSMEYVCLWSGMIVMKLTKTPLASKGDVHSFVLSKIKGVAKTNSAEMIHIHFAPSEKSSRC